MSKKLQMWVVKRRDGPNFKILPHTINPTRRAAIKAFLDKDCSSWVTAHERDLHWRWLRDYKQARAVKVSVQEDIK